jgi:hypothetical protein
MQHASEFVHTLFAGSPLAQLVYELYEEAPVEIGVPPLCQRHVPLASSRPPIHAPIQESS